MSIKPILKLIQNHQLQALTGSIAPLKHFYQLNYGESLYAFKALTNAGPF